jgi:hypothetical protein
LSRLRSSRGSKAAAPATKSGARPTVAAGRRPGVLVQAPKSDIFVAMLGVALGAIVLACLLMLLILWRYDFKANAKLAARDSSTRVFVAASQPGEASAGSLQRLS